MNNTRLYRVTKNNKANDRALFFGWDFEYFNEFLNEWREVINYSRKSLLKEMVLKAGVDFMEVSLVK